MKLFYSKIYIFILFPILITNCKSKVKIQDNDDEVRILKSYSIKFIDSPLLANVLSIAEKENKWIYMDVGAKWCAPCQQMKKNIYTDKTVSDYFNENFISYLVDAEKNEGPDIKLIYNISSYPTLLFIDSKGREMLRKEGGMSLSSLMEYGIEAVTLKGN